MTLVLLLCLLFFHYVCLFLLYVCLIAFFLISGNPLAAQYFAENKFTNYTTADGLSDNTITGIAQDPAGYIWLPTASGLNRYDGTRFVQYHSTGDAYLCSLPKTNIKPLYEFLLRQNYTLEGLALSIKDQAIILSLIIHDRYLNVETGLKMFQNLFEQADHYDNILVEEYGAVWRTE